MWRNPVASSVALTGEFNGAAVCGQMRRMQKWEFCSVIVTIYVDGGGGGAQELLETRMPGAHKTSVTNAYGSIGLINQLGSEGWELVDVESGTFYLKRQTKS
jgi:hypothetical protein